MRALLVAVALLAATSVPARAADRTVVLLSQLDACEVRRPETLAPKLDVLLGLADGRSAAELAAVLRGPRACIGHVTTYGEGDEELVFVGGLGPAGAGALLWVDDGWWRIAAVPMGFSSGTREVRHYGRTREFFAGISSGGSAGIVGIVGVRLSGPTATVMMELVPEAEIRQARLLDDDRLFVEGRLTGDRLLTWNSHVAWPHGAQWLFERQGGAFVEVAHRQAADPYYLMTGFVGALRTRDVAAMRRFATDAAVNEGLALPALDPRVTPLALVAPPDFLEREHLSWDALPTSIRTVPPSGPVWGFLADYDAQGRSLNQIVMRFDRLEGGWTITSVDILAPCGHCATRLV